VARVQLHGHEQFLSLAAYVVDPQLLDRHTHILFKGALKEQVRDRLADREVQYILIGKREDSAGVAIILRGCKTSSMIESAGPSELLGENIGPAL
jgi:hypothetical protein